MTPIGLTWSKPIWEILVGTVLEQAPIIRVSAKTGRGLMRWWKPAGDQQTASAPPDLGRPRLPVDRVFTLPGFGTILTGTLVDGQLAVGDEVHILPSGVKGRIRGLQTHKQSEQKALPGGRTAVNVSGVSVDAIFRGDVLVHPGDYQVTKMIDVYCKILPDAETALKHNMEVKLFLGSRSHRQSAFWEHRNVPRVARLFTADASKPLLPSG